jgi:hypothetical protein
MTTLAPSHSLHHLEDDLAQQLERTARRRERGREVVVRFRFGELDDFGLGRRHYDSPPAWLGEWHRSTKLPASQLVMIFTDERLLVWRLERFAELGFSAAESSRFAGRSPDSSCVTSLGRHGRAASVARTLWVPKTRFRAPNPVSATHPSRTFSFLHQMSKRVGLAEVERTPAGAGPEATCDAACAGSCGVRGDAGGAAARFR